MLTEVRGPSQAAANGGLQEWRRLVLQGLEFDEHNQTILTDIHGNQISAAAPFGRTQSFFATYALFTEQAMQPYRALVGSGQLATTDPAQAFAYLQQELEVIRKRETDLRRQMEYFKRDPAKSKSLLVDYQELAKRKRALESASSKLGSYFEFLLALEKKSKGVTVIFRAALEDMTSFAGAADKIRDVPLAVQALSTHSAYDSSAARAETASTIGRIEPWNVEGRAMRIDRTIFRTLQRIRNPAMALGLGALALGGGAAMAAENPPAQPRATRRPTIDTSSEMEARTTLIEPL
jgi:hypothetical protein